jgi:hypothetical protein
MRRNGQDNAGDRINDIPSPLIPYFLSTQKLCNCRESGIILLQRDMG